MNTESKDAARRHIRRAHVLSFVVGSGVVTKHLAGLTRCDLDMNPSSKRLRAGAAALAAALILLPSASMGASPSPSNAKEEKISPTGGPSGGGDVRTKFFEGTACPGNDLADTMVKVGSICVDVYEASVWSTATGGTQFGVGRVGYPCKENAQDCTNIFSRSVAGVIPSAFISWFQAQQACTNSGKRLLTNVEWQMAVAGTPDDDATKCNINSGSVARTGSFARCVSNHGMHDMVGNLDEWVADWVPLSTDCPGWNINSDDFMCLAGARKDLGPGALYRGGYYSDGASAGPFAVKDRQPSTASGGVGFRCGR